ncbi:hypothetical protein SBV1_370059 [Verrucomicrobia bacterium]|nr:hypothetical protein SBV1_370059 [Verrucomicrobiota bacterium]
MPEWGAKPSSPPRRSRPTIAWLINLRLATRNLKPVNGTPWKGAPGRASAQPATLFALV